MHTDSTRYGSQVRASAHHLTPFAETKKQKSQVFLNYTDRPVSYLQTKWYILFDLLSRAEIALSSRIYVWHRQHLKRIGNTSSASTTPQAHRQHLERACGHR